MIQTNVLSKTGDLKESLKMEGTLGRICSDEQKI